MLGPAQPQQQEQESEEDETTARNEGKNDVRESRTGRNGV